MKNHIIISLLFLLIGCSTSQQEYNYKDLIQMDNGLYTEKFSDEPISGKVYGYFGEVQPLKKVYMGNLRNGKKEGNWKSYHYNTGKKSYEFNFKNGKKDGLCTRWYDDGQKWNEGTFKDGGIDGLWTSYYENGEKRMRETSKDGEKDGLQTLWYENGQKSSERTYKDGELISEECWDEDGNECECHEVYWKGCK